MTDSVGASMIASEQAWWVENVRITLPMRTNLRLPAIPVIPCIDPFFQPGGEATALKIISTTECSCGHAVTPRVWTTEPASPEPPGEPSIGSCTSGELAKQDSRLAG